MLVMQTLMPVLTSLFLSLGIVLAVELITTRLRSKMRKAAHTPEGEPTERRAGESTD
jgi:hypothetical protein